MVIILWITITFFSEAFVKQPYYIIQAQKDNYLHLTGVSTTLSARDFFEKCFDGSLQESEFELKTHGKNERESKGTIRQKIKNLPLLASIISSSSFVQEDFHRNTVICSFASASTQCTVGFVASPVNARPKSLLNGNALDKSESYPISLCLSKMRKNRKFDRIEIGNIEILTQQYEIIQSILSDDLLTQIEEYKTKISNQTDNNAQNRSKSS